MCTMTFLYLKRFRREKCETLLYYDVTCHGLCPHTEKDWEKNKVFKNCPDGLAYHCARDNTTNEYVEACAEAVRCDRGKEPRLIFPAGHNKTARVICRYCHDEDFYNPIEFRLSSTYYECTEYKYPCSRYGIGKIRCDQNGIERHWKDNKCRCNERNMYIESNAACPIDFPCKDKTHFDFTCELYDCGKTSQGYWRNLTKDYCCACEDGYIRNETSNKCHKSSHDVSLQTTKISHHYTNMTVTATILMSSKVKINISASTKSSTHRDISISNIQPTTTAIPSLSGRNESILPIGIVVLVIVILILCILCIYIVCQFHKRMCNTCNRKDQEKSQDSRQSEQLLKDPSSANNQNEENSTQLLTTQSEDISESSLANNQNAGGSDQLPSDSSASVRETSFSKNVDGSFHLQSVSSASVQDSSTMTTTNVFSKENDMRIAEIGKITMQQVNAKIARYLNDTLTKERVTLEKLQVSSSVIQNAAGIDHPRIASVSSDISQESSSANDQIVPGPAKLSKTITPYNTDSEGSSADHIQNTLGIVQLRRDSVCSQVVANNLAPDWL